MGTRQFIGRWTEIGVTRGPRTLPCLARWTHLPWVSLVFRYVSGVSWARLQSGHHVGFLGNDLRANRAWTCQVTAKGLLSSSENPGAVEEHGALPWSRVERSARPTEGAATD